MNLKTLGVLAGSLLLSVALACPLQEGAIANGLFEAPETLVGVCGDDNADLADYLGYAIDSEGYAWGELYTVSEDSEADEVIEDLLAGIEEAGFVPEEMEEDEAAAETADTTTADTADTAEEEDTGPDAYYYVQGEGDEAVHLAVYVARDEEGNVVQIGIAGDSEVAAE